MFGSRSTMVMLTCLSWATFAGAGAASAANGLANSNFDTGVAGWSTLDGDLAWSSAVDVNACPGSGSASLSTPDFVAGDWTITLVSSGSCVPVAPGDEVAIRVRMKPGVEIANTDFGFLEYTDGACAEGEEERELVGYGVQPLIWLDFMMGATIFDGTHSVRLLIRYTDPTVSAFQVSLDSLYVGLDQPILLDDFEAGSTCRWSATVNDPN